MIKAAEKFAGTVLYDILTAVDALYAGIDADQKNWKAHTPAHCPDGCGSCCVHFEPEIYEAEALYLAVSDELHCSAHKLSGYISEVTEYHSGTLFFSLLRQYIVSAASLISISGHLS